METNEFDITESEISPEEKNRSSEKMQTALAKLESGSMTFEQILAMHNDLDIGVLNFDDDQMKELAESGKLKVDATRGYVEYCKKRGEYYGAIAEKFQKLASSFENRAESLTDYFAYQLQKFKFEKYPGKVWKATLRHSESTKALLKADAKLYFEYPHFISCKYSWNLTALKQALKAGVEGSEKLCEVVKKPRVQFTINDEISIKELKEFDKD